MLLDELTIRIEAGDGGNGIAAFNSNMMSLGPTGGSGGNGGHVYVVGVSDLGALNALRNQKVFRAEDGKEGRRQLNDGTDGVDCVIRVPVGTVVHNLTTGTTREIIAVDQRIQVARGGKGGRGNFHFRGPENTSPKQAEPGTEGEVYTLRLELKLIADVGLIGLPNVGKSSLINELTNANSKVANYHFTTLEPHLGAYYGLILADIPGLIEGASTGKGLGIKFLRHIERTRVLFHLVSADSEDPVRDYHTIRAELGAYNPALLQKKEYLLLSKIDAADHETVERHLKELRAINPTATPFSIHDTDAVARIQKTLNSIADDKERGA